MRRTAALPSGDIESLESRRALRQQVNLDQVVLHVTFKTTDGLTYTKDFASLAETYPHHRSLLRQLLKGAELLYAGKHVTYGSYSLLYGGTVEFVSFLNSDSAVLPQQVFNIADINWQVALSFRQWLIATYPNRSSNRKLYGALKLSVETIQRKHPKVPAIGEKFTWPPAPSVTDATTESYGDEVWHQMALACIADIKIVMKAMNGLGDILETAALVRHDEAPPMLENLCADLRHLQALAGMTNSDATEDALYMLVKERTRFRAYVKANNMTLKEFVRLYQRDGGILVTKGRPTFRHELNMKSKRAEERRCFEGYGRRQTSEMLIREVSRLYPSWPLNMSSLDAREVMAQKNSGTESSVDKRMQNYMAAVHLGDESSPIELGQMAYVAHKAFTAHTLFPFLLYVHMNTGWNLQVIVRMTESLDDHLGPCVEDADAVMLYGIKTKNAVAPGLGTLIPHKSSKTHPLSVYNVLRFIEKRQHNLRSSPHYMAGGLWKYITDKSRWVDDGVISDLSRQLKSYIKFYGAVSCAFLARHGICIASKAKKATIEPGRIRKTWVTKHQEMGTLFEQISEQLGHADQSTSDTHYDSDSASLHIKNARLRSLLDQQVVDVTSYAARLLESHSLQDLRKALARPRDRTRAKRILQSAQINSDAEIVHLLSPMGQTYIAACKNSRAPTWPGARRFVPESDDCRFFNMCCLCRQALIFKEALPYILRRIKDLDQLRMDRIRPVEWSREYGAEHQAWTEIISRWNNKDDVAAASEQVESGQVVLPLTMRGA